MSNKVHFTTTRYTAIVVCNQFDSCGFKTGYENWFFATGEDGSYTTESDDAMIFLNKRVANKAAGTLKKVLKEKGYKSFKIAKASKELVR